MIIFCGGCGKEMTPENARNRPELFLCDACLPREGITVSPPIVADRSESEMRYGYLIDKLSEQLGAMRVERDKFRAALVAITNSGDPSEMNDIAVSALKP